VRLAERWRVAQAEPRAPLQVRLRRGGEENCQPEMIVYKRRCHS
jgi:hypothetical protein